MQIPSVEQVTPGLWSLPVPIPDNPLGYTLVYLFETRKGPVLVDAGWDDPSSWEALCAGVAATGHAISDVHGILSTHHHPDHHGMTGRVQEASGCWVALHPLDNQLVARHDHLQEDQWLQQQWAALLDAGADEADLGPPPTPGRWRRPVHGVVADVALEDGMRPDVPGWDVQAIWTPGHSPGHTCFFVRGPELLLAGDHVLPVITPNIGLFAAEDPERDPLGDFFRSLRKVAAYPAIEVLPAHQRRFTGLVSRVAELLEFHLNRLRSIERSLAPGPRTAWEIASEMPWNRRWEDIPPMMKRLAVSEALAHVRYLERLGRVELVRDLTPTTFCLTRRAAEQPLAL
jgi:glyoxylase-like metal-dependent hydrolase (beta-lactamase superfamily II)